jgi:Asp-tRNA(Asn)/Glu-tRNA(Gln) amidotransferase A subunit family amidase
MVGFSDFWKYDGLGLADLVRRKQVSPEELLEKAIENIEKVNHSVNAVITRMYDKAQEAIRSGLPEGPFRGVPFLLKDLRASCKGVVLTGGHKLMSCVPDFDSEIVVRHKRAGLVIMGKTNIPEMGLSVHTDNKLFGPTRNPWATDRISGGSSGGSAAAVASRMVPMAHATDGGGSTRIPASCCGVFGLKATRARTPFGPDVGEELAGTSTQHAITLSVRDSAALLDATEGPALGDPYWAPPKARPYIEEIGANPGRLRIAFTAVPPSSVEVHPECIAAMMEATKLCEALGHHLEEARPDVEWNEGLGDAMNLIFGAGMLSNLKEKTEKDGVVYSKEDFQPNIWNWLELGEKFSAADYYRAVKKLHVESRKVARFFEKYDLLLTPTLGQPPLPMSNFDLTKGDIEAYTKQLFSFAAFTPLFNVTGQPAMTVPLYWNNEGLPIGVQFAARFGDEASLFRLAAQLEEARPWFNRQPPINAISG